METIHLHASDVYRPTGLVVALGFFDGMHTAHRTLLERAVASARERRTGAALYTFSTQVLSHLSHAPFYFLTSLAEKEAEAAALGFDRFVVFEVDDTLVALEPEEFIHRFLEGCAEVVIGFDFTFGRFGRGNAALLRDTHRFDVSVVSEISYRGAKIGSTRIREALASGRLDFANRLLGHPYTIAGTVVRGKGRGMILGFPTANVDYDGYFLPKEGVYATRVRIGEQWYEAMTNIGDNPTFSGTKVTLEAHIFGFHGTLYGERIAVAFHAFLRPEVRYSTTADLIHQMQEDQSAVHEYFARGSERNEEVR